MVNLVFISVDPRRDSPEKMMKFSQDYRPNTIYLTGNMDEITSVAKKYRVYFNKPTDDAQENYQIDHSLYTFFLNSGGRVVDFFSNQLSAQDVADKILEYHKAVPLEAQQANDPSEAAKLAPAPATAVAQ